MQKLYVSQFITLISVTGFYITKNLSGLLSFQILSLMAFILILAWYIVFAEFSGNLDTAFVLRIALLIHQDSYIDLAQEERCKFVESPNFGTNL